MAGKACYGAAMASLQDMSNKTAPAAFRRIAPARFAALTVPALTVLLLAGCAKGDYPSLQRWPAPHPITQPAGQIAAPPAPEPVHPHVAPGCDEAAAQSIDTEFRAAVPAAETATKAASDAAPGSPLWSKGNLALASLQQIRARMSQVLGASEEAYAADTIGHAQDDQRDGLAARADGAKLAVCHAHIAELADQEDAVIDRLHAQLPD